ncbi:MAG TPA: hypothetical protein VFZ27_10980 [Terriglobia bacterium]|nr:hypothetical protein [Terriglobia bacterium]
MQELSNNQRDAREADATLEGPQVALGSHEVKFLVEVLNHPDHKLSHIHVRRDATLLEVLDESARNLDVKLLPTPQTTLDRLHGVYEDHRIGEPLDLNLNVEEFLQQEPKTHHLAIELVLAIEINTRWRIAPEKEMTPKAILALAGLPWEQYSLYYPADSVDPLPPDAPLELHRGQRFEAQRDGKYGAGACDAHRVC